MKPGDFIYLRCRYEGKNNLPWDQRACVAVTLLGPPQEDGTQEELMASWVEPGCVITQGDLVKGAHQLLKEAQRRKGKGQHGQ